MANRAGILHIGVLIVCVVLIIGAFAFHYGMRHGRTNAYRSLHGEHAAMLARSGLSIAQVHLGRTFADKASAARARLLAPLGTGRVELGTADLAAGFPELLQKLKRDLPHGLVVTGLDVNYGVVTAAALPPVTLADRTLARGDREKAGELYIECTARLSTGGPLGEVSRTVRAVHQFRVVAAPVPLLSDFSLFLEDKPPTGGWGKPSPLAKLKIKNSEWGSDLKAKEELDLDGVMARALVFQGDNDRGGGSGRNFRPQLTREMLPGPWADTLDKFEPGQLTLAELAPQLAQVACWNAEESATAFLERRGMLEDGRLDLGTSVRATGPLRMPDLKEVGRGGLLIASEITIAGEIPRPERGVLVLVATEGNIRIAGGVPVHASLIALKGSVIFDGAPNVHGNIVAVKAETGGLTEGSKLTYDGRLKERPFGNGPSESLIIDFARKPSLVD